MEFSKRIAQVVQEHEIAALSLANLVRKDRQTHRGVADEDAPAKGQHPEKQALEREVQELTA